MAQSTPPQTRNFEQRRGKANSASNYLEWWLLNSATNGNPLKQRIPQQADAGQRVSKQHGRVVKPADLPDSQTDGVTPRNEHRKLKTTSEGQLRPVRRLPASILPPFSAVPINSDAGYLPISPAARWYWRHQRTGLGISWFRIFAVIYIRLGTYMIAVIQNRTAS